MPRPDVVSLPSEEEYLNCIRCGLCLAVCPTYRESLHEIDSPRGRVALARKGLIGELTLGPNLFEQMNACFDCLACNEICPVGIHPADLAVEMRRVQEQARPAMWKQMVFGEVLRKPGLLEAVTGPLRLYQRLGLRRLVYGLGLRKLMPRRLRDLESLLPPIPRRPLRRVLPEVTEARDGSK
jgi:glycolate oxidase iron-sulfur subunit